MYNIFGVPRAITLNSEGEQYDRAYIHDQDSYGARWIRDKGELEDTKIYIGIGSGGRLGSQAGIWGCEPYSLFVAGRKIDRYIYLRYYNVVNGKLLDWKGEEPDMTEYQDKFVGKSKIYSNGCSEIYK